MRGHWFAWLGALEEGDAPLARAKVDEILKHSQKIEIRRMTDLSLSATLFGRRQLAAGKREIAREAFTAAMRLDPDLPDPRWARLSLAISARSFKDFVPELLGALRATFADSESRRIVLVRLVLIFLLTACAAALASLLVSLVQYGPRLVHDLKEAADGLLHGRVPSVAVAAFLVLPLLLSLDVLWLALFLFVLLFGYASLGQKLATSLALVLAILLLPALDRVAYDLAVTSSPILRAAEALEESRYDQRVLDGLEAAKNILPDDVDIRFLLGRLYQSLGQNDRAIAEYTTGSHVAPRDIRCLVNRGNIRFVDGDLGSAQEDYQEALKRDGRSIAARYNLALLYAETFRTIEAAQVIQEARALDARAVQSFQETPTLVKVVSLGYTPEEARAKVEAMEQDNRTRRLLGQHRGYRLGDGLGIPRLPKGSVPGNIGIPFFWAVLVAIGGAIFLDRRRGLGRGYASECQKCGRAFCRLCKPPGESALLCSQCVHVYLKKDGVAIETKLHKLEDVRRRRTFEDRVRLILNTLLPGSAAFLDSRLLPAIVAFGLFAYGLLAVLLRDALATLPRPTLGAGTPGIVFWLLVALAGWITGLVTSTRRT